ncbi:MAG: alpha/beta hydrolase [Meiothermus sp.]
MSRRNIFWLFFFGLLLVFAGTVVSYTRNALKSYPPTQAALQALEPSPTLQVQKTGYGWVFIPRGTTKGGFAFYPGGLVEPQAYAPPLRKIAEGGYRVALLQVPFNLAVTAQGKARDAIAEAPNLRWAVGGHSLGGVVASNFAQSNPDAKAIVMWSSYPQNDLSALEKPTLLLRGDRDGVVRKDRLEQNRAKFPKNTQFVSLPGLDHASFGGYGPQRGDNAATVGKEEGWDLIAKRTLEFLDKLPGQ